MSTKMHGSEYLILKFVHGRYKFQIFLRMSDLSQKCLCKYLHLELCFQKCVNYMCSCSLPVL